jgi:CheY-like chemotaxis protein
MMPTRVSPRGEAPAAVHVLVADDVRESRNLLTALVEDDGCAVTAVASGAEAVEQARSGLFDVVLLDLLMPGMDGIEACMAIRSDPRAASASVVMITALADDDTRRRCLAAGADDFIAKPFDRWEVRARVQSLSRLATARRAAAERELLRSVLATAADGYALVSRDDEIIYANPRARDLLSLQGSTAPATRFRDRCATLFHLEPEAGWARWNESDGVHEPLYLLRHATPGSDAVWIRVSATDTALAEAGQRAVRLEDVTVEMQGQLRHWEFREFVSHKLRTPLNGVTAPLELLGMRQAELPQDLRELVAICRNSAQRLSSAVADVLRPFDVRPADGERLPVSAIHGLADECASAEGIALPVFDVIPGLDQVAVRIGEPAMRAIIAEALRNAHRFHPARAPKMTISVRPTDDGALRLDFVDDGVHLSTQQLSLAFRPYYQADPHHTGEIPGMGIGLSHVLALVWNHGGSCSLRNRADAPGVCLSVTLPAVMTAAC